MSKKYQYCEGRQTDNDKQNRQREYDKLFKSINGYMNPPRKKEEDYFFNTVRSLEATNSFIRKELSAFVGMNRR